MPQRTTPQPACQASFVEFLEGFSEGFSRSLKPFQELAEVASQTPVFKLFRDATRSMAQFPIPDLRPTVEALSQTTTVQDILIGYLRSPTIEGTGIQSFRAAIW